MIKRKECNLIFSILLLLDIAFRLLFLIGATKRNPMQSSITNCDQLQPDSIKRNQLPPNATTSHQLLTESGSWLTTVGWRYRSNERVSPR